MKNVQNPLTLEEINKAYPRAVEKMSGLMRRFGNEDGGFDGQYLAQLIIEDVQIHRLQAHLTELQKANQGKQDKKRYAPESTHPKVRTTSIHLILPQVRHFVNRRIAFL